VSLETYGLALSPAIIVRWKDVDKLGARAIMGLKSGADSHSCSAHGKWRPHPTGGDTVNIQTSSHCIDFRVINAGASLSVDLSVGWFFMVVGVSFRLVGLKLPGICSVTA